MKILLIQLRRIGDVLMTTPAVRALRNCYPSAQLEFLTEAPSDQIFEYQKKINEVIVFPRKGGVLSKIKILILLRRKRYDIIVDFFGNPTSAMISLLTGAPRRIGFDFRGRRWAYTERVLLSSEKSPYSVAHKLSLIEPLQCKTESFDLEFDVSEREVFKVRDILFNYSLAGSIFMTLSPVSRQPYKVWPAKNFAEIADRVIQEFQIKIVIFHGPNEEAYAESVQSQMEQKAVIIPLNSLLLTRALLGEAVLHLGNDNGPRHFAIAAQTPTVAVFGQGWADNWTPPNSKIHRTIEWDPGCKNACVYPKCKMECIKQVPVDQVWGVLKSLLHKVLQNHEDCRSN